MTNDYIVGDTLETLKQLDSNLIDITCTSPPFNKGEKYAGGLVKNVKYSNSSDNIKEEEYQKQQIDVLNEIYRVTAPGGHIFYNHKLRWMNGKMIHPMEWLSKTNWDIRQEIIWNRIIAANIQSWRFWQVDDRIYWMQKGITKGQKLQSKHAKLSSIWKIVPERNFKDEHPAPFPIALPTRCISAMEIPERKLNVLDPYAGIGTTLVSANYLGHSYLGIDISPEYATVAQQRVNNPTPADIKAIKEERELHVVYKKYKRKIPVDNPENS